MAGVVALRRFDLDHVRAEVGEHERAVGAREGVRQIEDADAFKRQHAFRL
jgi:hypothetical protein